MDQHTYKQLKQLDKIQYIGDSLVFGGKYTIIPIESTYYEASECPEEDMSKLCIVKFDNSDNPIFFLLEDLNMKEWRLV